MLPKMSGYVKDETKYLSFSLKKDELLKNKIKFVIKSASV